MTSLGKRPLVGAEGQGWQPFSIVEIGCAGIFHKGVTDGHGMGDLTVADDDLFADDLSFGVMPLLILTCDEKSFQRTVCQFLHGF